MGVEKTYPAKHFQAVTPSDIADIDDSSTASTIETRGIYIGTAGDLTVKDSDGNNVLFKNLLAGIVYPIATHRVMSTGTTAGDIVAMW
jgi:hypothetical protein